MHMPQPTAEHRKLEKLEGRWTGEETMHPSAWDPNGGKATGTSHNRADLGGFVVIGDYRQERDGQTTFAGHAVYTWDPVAGQVVLYWFDCMGTPPNLFRGHFEDDVLTLISDESSDAGPRFTRLTCDLSEDGLMPYRMEMSHDGRQWDPLMDARYVRTGAPADSP